MNINGIANITSPLQARGPANSPVEQTLPSAPVQAFTSRAVTPSHQTETNKDNQSYAHEYGMKGSQVDIIA
jgi:hypothetical protein